MVAYSPVWCAGRRWSGALVTALTIATSPVFGSGVEGSNTGHQLAVDSTVCESADLLREYAFRSDVPQARCRRVSSGTALRWSGVREPELIEGLLSVARVELEDQFSGYMLAANIASTSLAGDLAPTATGSLGQEPATGGPARPETSTSDVALESANRDRAVLTLPRPAAASIAREFAISYLDFWSAPNPTTLHATPVFYADRVVFHGRAMTSRQLVAEKKRFLRRWPERQYVPHRDVAKSTCTGDVCNVRLPFDFSATSRARKTHSEGTGILQLAIRFSAGRPAIVRENSRVTRLSRSIASLH